MIGVGAVAAAMLAVPATSAAATTGAAASTGVSAATAGVGSGALPAAVRTFRGQATAATEIGAYNEAYRRAYRTAVSLNYPYCTVFASQTRFVETYWFAQVDLSCSDVIN